MHKFVEVFKQACLKKTFDKFVYGVQPQQKNENHFRAVPKQVV